jgi:pilus assembly protein CpaE
VLLAPDQLQRAEAIRGDDMQRVLAGLKPYFDYTVVDTSPQFTPVTVAALDEADLIVLVVTPELVAIRDAARFLQLAVQLGYGPEKVLLVANRADAGRDISLSMVEQKLGRGVAATIPSDGRAMIDSMSRGELIAAAQPRHKVSQGFTNLARLVAGALGWDPEAKGTKTIASTTATPSPSAGGDIPAALTGPAAPNSAATGTLPSGRTGRSLPKLARGLFGAG